MKNISIVIPLCNEESNLEELYSRLVPVMESLGSFSFEIIFVNDGSLDRTVSVLRELRKKDPRVKYISFSRNFGHESATSAGLARAGGDGVILMDGDLQDPPELIPSLVEKWVEGWDVVYGYRESRPGEGWMKVLTSYLFYRMINLLSYTPLPADVGDFRLMDKKVVREFNRLKDYNRMVRAMITWLGFKQTGIPYERSPRFKGKTNYSFLELLWLSFDALTGYSIIPLRLSIWMGFFVMFNSLMAGVIVLGDFILGGIPLREMQGYTLQTVGLFFLGGVQLFMLGIIGEYIGKIYQQTLARPLYIVEEEEGFSPGDSGKIKEDMNSSAD